MNIGTFAQNSGLTVKALRHYDSIGLLHPDDVDPFNGYRSYSPSQLRTAATISLLRSMGLPLPLVAEAVAEPERAEAIVERHTEQRRRQLEDELRLLDEGAAILHAYHNLPPIETREAPEEHWIGLRQEIPLDADDETSAEFDDSADRFMAAAFHSGAAQTARAWATFESVSEETVTALWCVPLTGPLPDASTFAEFDWVSGTLPARTEHVVTAAGPATAMPEGTRAPHPAVIALSEAGFGEDAAVRQAYVFQPDGPATIEVIADVPTVRA